MNLPRHPKAREFRSLGLLAGIQSFSELEARIAALPSEQARGAALEVFAEACLTTQRIYQAHQVWPGNSIPSSLRQQLHLPMADMGVDGIFITADEDPVCYQSKFRTGRPALSWTELSTFYGLADVGRRRLVFTNCDEVSRVAQERLGAVFIRGSDLDRLTPDDFKIIEAWIAEQPAKPEKKDPKPHQVVAVNDIVNGLSRGPRATALMACGSGKTLVALWAAERLAAQTVLVLLPSLALVRQTLHEWLHETSWPEVQFICVCSDPTVQTEEDSLLVRPSDLDFAVTTQSADVHRFLGRPTQSVRLVFSTYQSSQVVKEAISGLPPFDLGIFDEAHKTAGREGAKFALALKDENLPITRRLFVTATPRHYDIAKKDKFGESKVVFSMNMPETYGPVVHRLPFNAAARAGIITDYKVIISVVTSEMVTNEALRLGVVLVEGDEVKARQVANQIALKSAIEKYNVAKVFTFHSRVNSAKSFTSSGPDGVGTHLEGFHCAHIEGAMATVYRERLLREFAATPRAILSNARCLTEGVDVPAVDMVAFLSPKRSLVDIVQATGRAMRRSPGKDFGYVLVPLYVEKARGETTEQAVLRSNFDEVWRVLQSLKEQDDLLAQAIAQMRIERGRTGGFDDSRFRERVEVLAPEISLDILRSTITALCIDAIGENWFERYGQLVEYKQTHGDCDIPARWEANQKLATWVVDQRVRKRDDNLEPEKIELLDRLGFNWSPRQTNWRSVYLELVNFHKLHGHCRVPQKWKQNKSLAYWVATQRYDYSKGVLPRDRILLLDRLGFDWHVSVGSWDGRFAELCAFKERFGHTRVTVNWPENPLLGKWVVSQRHKNRKGQLAEHHVNRLNDIGFVWDGRTAAKRCEKKQTDPEKQWRAALDRLKAYTVSHGVAVVRVVDEETKKLNRWILYQRQAKKRGRLSEERTNALNELGFVWQQKTRSPTAHSTPAPAVDLPITRTWDEMYSELVEFFKLHGHCNVPDNWSAQPSLPFWVSQQRRSKKRNQLTPEQASQMDAIGFAWSTHEGGWDAMFAKLVEHMRPMNNGRQRGAPANDELKRWMLTQRQSKKRGDLDSAREMKLTSIGFEWEPFTSRWLIMLAELKQFHAAHGHCQVPAGWVKNPALANWVGIQRARKLDGKLSIDRQRALDELGFTWRLGEFNGNRSPQEAWKTMLERLVAFHMENGHSSVPQIYSRDQKLGWWVTTQRRNRRKGKLTTSQITALDSLCFDWEPFDLEGSSDRWQTMLEALTAFRQQFGHCRVPAGWKDNSRLANWVGVQRRTFKLGRMSQNRIKMLDNLGFQWAVQPRGATGNVSAAAISFEQQWQVRFAELVAYKQANGNCRVPSGWSNNAQLANWVSIQRRRYKQGKLSADRVTQLQAIGFDWVVGQIFTSRFPFSSGEDKEKRWNSMFEKLSIYKAEHGDCLVPQRWKEDPNLADWVSKMRLAYNRGMLSTEKIRRLEEIAFDWDPVGTRWEDMFQQLVEFKQQHGHTNVPQNSPNHRELAFWVRSQRAAKRYNRPIVKLRGKRLDEIGFAWRLVDRNSWDNMFALLMAYRKTHGNCNVPQKGGGDKRLGRWVNTQRIHFKRGTLNFERQKRLEAIGFIWNLKNQSNSSTGTKT